MRTILGFISLLAAALVLLPPATALGGECATFKNIVVQDELDGIEHDGIKIDVGSLGIPVLDRLVDGLSLDLPQGGRSLFLELPDNDRFAFASQIDLVAKYCRTATRRGATPEERSEYREILRFLLEANIESVRLAEARELLKGPYGTTEKGERLPVVLREVNRRELRGIQEVSVRPGEYNRSLVPSGAEGMKCDVDILFLGSSDLELTLIFGNRHVRMSPVSRLRNNPNPLRSLVSEYGATRVLASVPNHVGAGSQITMSVRYRCFED